MQKVSRLATIRRGQVSSSEDFRGKRSSVGNIFWFLQNKAHFAIRQCKLHRATCRRFDTIPACDGRTDRRNCRSQYSACKAARCKKKFNFTEQEVDTGLPTIHQPGFYAAPNFLKMWIKYLNLSSFIHVSTIKDEKSAAKFHYIKTVSGKLVAQTYACIKHTVIHHTK